MNEEFNRGVFEGQVLAKLDGLYTIADEIKKCQHSLKERVGKLEHQETRIRAFAAFIGSLASLIVALAMKLWVK